MSFFGFEETDLEKEKRKFQSGTHENEDLAVYTWGEDSYDGLGDALQEGGDELNDETFGGTGAVGKDFDFSSTAGPASSGTPQPLPPAQSSPAPPDLARPASNGPSIWDDKSLSSFLPRSNGGNRSALGKYAAEPQSRQESPLARHQQPLSHGITQQGARTVQEIEAEMRNAALQQQQQHQARDTNHLRQRAIQEAEERVQQELLLQHHQQQREQLLLQKEEERARQQQQQEQLYIQQLQQQELRQQEDMRQQEEMRQQEQQNQLQRLWEHQQMQQYQNLHQRTPPPRMLPQAQSSRIQDNLYQQQVLLLQQQQQQQRQEQQQLAREQQLQEQIRMEELERQLRAQQLGGRVNQSPVHFNGRQRHNASPSLAELQAAQQMLQHQRQHSGSPGFDGQYSHETQHRIQLQQRLVSEMVQAELMRDMQGASPAQKEALRAEAMKKIVEAEKTEERRRRKAAKIAYMSRYNDLMTQSDKDFITRIQVSQLVTQDPYAEDFYAQVYGAILRNRMGIQSQDERVLKFGTSGGVGLGLATKGPHRRPNAMQRMEAQVERIVSNAKLREKEKQSFNSLQGALGKTSGRSYKAAPRQLLQVDASNASNSPTLAHASAHISKDDSPSPQEGTAAAEEAAKLGREALGAAAAADSDGLIRTDPLTHRQALVMLEGLYDMVLEVEQLRRDQPPEEEEDLFNQWQGDYDHCVEEIFKGLKVMAPLETSNPHPFVSLLEPIKGKKLLPRLSRHLRQNHMLTILTLLVACFSQLDVVKDGPILDSCVESPERAEAEKQTHCFLGTVMQSILPLVAKSNLRLISGLLGLLLDRTDIIAVAYTKPGIALLTVFLSQVEIIKQNMSSTPAEDPDYPTPEEAQQWQLMFDHLFQLLTPSFLHLFPSTRMAPSMPAELANDPSLDILDQPVWSFLAALALHAVPQQHEILVTTLREKVLHNVLSANKGWVPDEEARQTKLANVNVFLHALGLDSSLITM